MRDEILDKIIDYIVKYAGEDKVLYGLYDETFKAQPSREVALQFLGFAKELLNEEFGKDTYTAEQAMNLLFKNAHTKGAYFDYLNQTDYEKYKPHSLQAVPTGYEQELARRLVNYMRGNFCNLYLVSGEIFNLPYDFYTLSSELNKQGFYIKELKAYPDKITPSKDKFVIYNIEEEDYLDLELVNEQD